VFVSFYSSFYNLDISTCNNLADKYAEESDRELLVCLFISDYITHAYQNFKKDTGKIGSTHPAFSVVPYISHKNYKIHFMGHFPFLS